MVSRHRVLVTGISGFLGGHLALALLNRGFAVRGSLRDLTRSDAVRESLAQAGADVDHLELCALDLLDDRGWAEAAAGCDFCQHVASPFVTLMPEDDRALIEPAVEGTRRAIRAALTAGHQRIVVTSSVAAIDGGHGRYDRPLTVEDWTNTDGPRVNAYVKAKTAAERAAWTLVEEKGAREKLCVVNPGTMLGPLLDDDPGISVAMVQRLLKGQMPMIPDLILPYVDVRDVAEAHVAAMLAPHAAARRHIVTNASRSLTEIADILRTAMPDVASSVPMRRLPAWLVPVVALFDKSLRDNSAWLSVVRRYDHSSGTTLLDRPLRTVDEAVVASARTLLSRGLA